MVYQELDLRKVDPAMSEHIPHWEWQFNTQRDDSGGIAEYDPGAECPFKVSSMRQITPGIPTLTEEAMGWLAYSWRRTCQLSSGKWGKDAAGNPSWDN